MKRAAVRRGEGIGFSQRIRLDWLDYTANAVLAGSPEDEIVAALRERLRERFSLGGERVSGNRDKAVAILTRVWVTVPEELRTLRGEGLDLLRQADAEGPDAGALVHVHGGLSLLRRGRRGDRAAASLAGNRRGGPGAAPAARTVGRARDRRPRRAPRPAGVHRLGGSAWRLAGRGSTALRRRVPSASEPLAVWVLKAMLSAGEGNPKPPSGLLRAPPLFPFEIALPSTAALEACSAFEIVRHGLDHEVLVGLADTARSCGTEGRT